MVSFYRKNHKKRAVFYIAATSILSVTALPDEICPQFSNQPCFPMHGQICIIFVIAKMRMVFDVVSCKSSSARNDIDQIRCNDTKSVQYPIFENQIVGCQACAPPARGFVSYVSVSQSGILRSGALSNPGATCCQLRRATL